MQNIQSTLVDACSSSEFITCVKSWTASSTFDIKVYRVPLNAKAFMYSGPGPTTNTTEIIKKLRDWLSPMYDCNNIQSIPLCTLPQSSCESSGRFLLALSLAFAAQLLSKSTCSIHYSMCRYLIFPAD